MGGGRRPGPAAVPFLCWRRDVILSLRAVTGGKTAETSRRNRNDGRKMSCNQTDEELARLAQAWPESLAGRKAAACLLQRHTRKVYVWCRRYSLSDEEARDLSQDVLLQAYRGLAAYNHRSRFTSWLFSVTRNRCLSHVRRRPPRPATEVDPDSLPADGLDPEDALLEHLDLEALGNLIRQELDPTEQEVVWLRCVERMSIRHINTVLGLQNTSGARAVLQRARRKLRAAWNPPAARAAGRDHG
jgi:RNA polymerase sigma-70 factor (ECF subfamily)